MAFLPGLFGDRGFFGAHGDLSDFFTKGPLGPGDHNDMTITTSERDFARGGPGEVWNGVGARERKGEGFDGGTPQKVDPLPPMASPMAPPMGGGGGGLSKTDMQSAVRSAMAPQSRDPSEEFLRRLEGARKDHIRAVVARIYGGG